MEINLKLKIKFNGKEILLTEDEARDLYNKLDKLFGRYSVPWSIPYPIPIEPIYPSYPIITWDKDNSGSNHLKFEPTTTCKVG